MAKIKFPLSISVVHAVVALNLIVVAGQCVAKEPAELPPPCCVTAENPAVDKFIKDFSGKPESVVIAEAKRLGITIRIGQRDSQHFAGTMDYNPNRVTVQIIKGQVTSMFKG